MPAKLHITDGKRSWSVDLTEPEITLGRDPATNRIVLEDSTVSREHAVLQATADGYQISDLKSSRNGVQVNGKAIPKDQPYPLKNGARIEMGAVELIYEQSERRNAPDPPKKRGDKLADRVVTPSRQAAKPMDDDKYAKVRSLLQPFRIQCHGDTDRWRPEVERTLKRAYDRVGQKLSYYPPTVTVEVHPTGSQMVRAGQREGKRYAQWAAAVYDNGVIHIETSPRALPAPEELYIILTHEYVHLVVDSKTGGRCPFWLNEGVAQTEAEVLTRHDLRKLTHAIGNRTYIPLQQLERPFIELPDEKRVRLAYLESHAAVEYFVERYDWSGVRRLLDGLANGVSIEAALGAVELDYRGLEDAVERWVAGRL